jgi:hypothetical protein
VVLEPGSLQPNANALGEVVSKFAAKGANVSDLSRALIAKFGTELASQIARIELTEELFAGQVSVLTEMRGYLETLKLADFGDIRFATAAATERRDKRDEIGAAITLHSVLDNIPTPSSTARDGGQLMQMLARAEVIPPNMVPAPRVQAKLEAIVAACNAEANEISFSLATKLHVLRITNYEAVGGLSRDSWLTDIAHAVEDGLTVAEKLEHLDEISRVVMESFAGVPVPDGIPVMFDNARQYVSTH